MAGHSKWANIRHRKERQDKKKGKIWSKCSKAIMAAAREGGPDPDSNLSLRYAIDEAKYANMPKDTIQRAIDKGAGSAGGDAFELIVYEGYGPAGVAIIVDALTDNRTRTVNDVRFIFGKHGGNLGNPGSVAFMFQTRGQILIPAKAATEEQLLEHALEAGAEDIEAPEGDDGFWVVSTQVNDYMAVRQALEAAGIGIESAEITKIPDQTVALGPEDSEKLMRLIDALEDNDDVQKVYSTAEMSETQDA